MASPPIYNSLAQGDLHVIEVVNPNQIDFYATSLANQFNNFRMTYKPQKMVRDLSAWISDIIVETSAQGGSLLEVHIIDPAWTLFLRDANGVCFIDVDDTGYLWPPVEVNFPPEVSDATWRLCQCQPSTDLNAANVILVFEDKIVSELREHYGAQSSYPNQTRAEFMQSLIQQANNAPAYPGEVKIRFRSLLPAETFTQADLSLSEQIPSSAVGKFAPPARKHPNKEPAATFTPKQATTVQQAMNGVNLSIQQGIDAISSGIGFAPSGVPWLPPGSQNPNSADYVPNASYIPGLGNNP